MAIVDPHVYHFLSILSALKVQRDTGLRHSRGSVLKVLERDFGLKFKTCSTAIQKTEGVKELVIMHVVQPDSDGTWVADVDYADEDMDPIKSAKAFATKHKLTAETLELVGPGGAWPIIRFRGKPQDLFPMVMEYAGN